MMSRMIVEESTCLRELAAELGQSGKVLDRLLTDLHVYLAELTVQMGAAGERIEQECQAREDELDECLQALEDCRTVDEDNDCSCEESAVEDARAEYKLWKKYWEEAEEYQNSVEDLQEDVSRDATALRSCLEDILPRAETYLISHAQFVEDWDR